MAGARSILQGVQQRAGLKLFTWAAGGAATDYDWGAIDEHYRVVNVWILNTTGTGGACTITVKAGANAITDGIDCNKADNTMTPATTIDDAYSAMVPGTTLRATSSAAEDTVIVCVLAELYSA